MPANQRVRASRCPQKDMLRSPFAPTRHDLPLPKPFRGTILPSKPPGIWRMSAKTARLFPPQSHSERA